MMNRLLITALLYALLGKLGLLLVIPPGYASPVFSGGRAGCRLGDKTFRLAGIWATHRKYFKQDLAINLLLLSVF